jgi:hypothetical protein
MLAVSWDTNRLFLHIRSRTPRSRTPRARAIMGALTGLSALAALFLGVLLAG